MNRVLHADNLEALSALPDAAFQLIYLDPPFNSGSDQGTERTVSVRDPEGTRTGFRGSSYRSVREKLTGYTDSFSDYCAFLEPRLLEARRLLAETGTLYVHLDYREAHYIKVMMDEIFGRQCFLNEIIWAYDYGARTKKRWPAKHQNILVYVKNPQRYFFNSAEVDREPYMAPSLVTAEKAALGKLPTDVWWHTIVSPTSREKTGYPTQKPLGIMRRIIQASSAPGDWVLDAFAGSGTTGAAAAELGRQFVMIDERAEAIEVMRHRFAQAAIDVAFDEPAS